MEFQKSVYGKVDEQFNLILNNKFESQFKRISNDQSNVIEESLETFILFHLDKVINLDLISIFRSPEPTYGSEDICALDHFGRVHLFELKKRIIDEKAIDQLHYYLLSHAFENIETFLSNRMKESKKLFSSERIALYLIGILTNKKTSTFGFKEIEKVWNTSKPQFVRDIFKEHPVTKHYYNQLSDNAIFELKAKTLIKKSRKNIDYDTILEISKKWSNFFLQKIEMLPKDRRSFIIKRPMVIWLIAPTINKKDKTIKMIKELRKIGVDTRVVIVGVKKVQKDTSWLVRIQKEYAEKREMIEKQAENYASRNLQKDLQIIFKYYNEKSASDSKKDGGDLLTEPQIVFLSGNRVYKKFN